MAGERTAFLLPDSYMGVETMSMRGRAVVVFGLVGACLQALLAVKPAKGAENNMEAYAFVRGGKLSEGTKVSEDQFGSSVAVSADTVLVGVPTDNEKGAFAGTVYVFHRDEEGVWQQVQKLTASNGTAYSYFGASITISGDLALVGARGASPHGNFSGAVYAFARGADGVWNEAQILDASDGAAGNFFGWSVALNGAAAIIGARGNGDDPNFPGASYVFTRGTDGQWVQQQKLTATDGEGGDEFGFSVALFDETALIGAPGENEKGSLAGAAYLFVRDADGQWVQQQKLTSNDGASGDEFGDSVALLGNAAFIGAPFAESLVGATEEHTGAVYVYGPETESSGALWKETQKLTADDGKSGDEFGGSVAATEMAIMIGAQYAVVNGSSRGASYVFTRVQESETSVSWTEHQKILAKDGASGDSFGASVALRDEWAVVGSPLDDITVDDPNGDGDAADLTTYTNTGSAYVLALTPIPATCPIKTDYTDAKCSGTFYVASLTDLEEYVANNFGQANNDGKYSDLNVTASLSNDSLLILQSPCEIILDTSITLSGKYIVLDGLKGIKSKRPNLLNAEKVCLSSAQGDVNLGESSFVDVGELTLQAGEKAEIGKNSIVTTDGVLSIESIGSGKSSSASIDTGVVVSAGSMEVKSARSAQLGDSSRLSVDGALSLASTEDESGSEAAVGKRVQIQATDLTLTSPRSARVGKDASVVLSGQLQIESTGSDSKSEASIQKGSQVVVGGDGELVSGNKASLDKNVSIAVNGNFRMEAGSADQCKIKDAEEITAGSTSGNCF